MQQKYFSHRFDTLQELNEFLADISEEGWEFIYTKHVGEDYQIGTNDPDWVIQGLAKKEKSLEINFNHFNHE